MRRFCYLAGQVAALAAGLGLLAGCGKIPDPSTARQPSKAVVTQAIPKLGDYLPPLDRDRLELAPPEGWYVPSASRDYVVRVQKSDREKYPSVIVTAEDYQDESIFNVSKKNVGKFAAQVAAAAKKKRSAVRAIELGQFVGVAYRKRAKVRTPVTRILDVFYLETVVAGRKYRIALRSEEGSLEKDRPYLFAVVKGIRFLGAKPEEKSLAATQQAPTEKPQPTGAVKKEAEQQPEAKPKVKRQEEAKKKPKRERGVELDLDKLEKLLE